ncbi:MAG TPA: YetF domain-containing protein [Pyrinomonadaceae bacterium]|nr:YetF domain-containing protein [Pyrinomonadaceae bacterium]
MFFDDWSGIVRILIVGVLAYIALIIFLRVSGKRTLSKWNAFDFVVTIALGSTLASVIISKDVVLIEGVIAFALLIGLQFVITRLSVRFDFIKNVVKAKPTLLFDKGEFLPEAMRRQRVAESEIRAAIRSNGLAAIEEIEAVVLETDGTFSVVKKSANDSRTALKDVK